MADSTNAQIGSQTQVWYWDTDLTPDAYVQIPNIRSFGPTGATKPEVDSTDLDSTGVQRIGGLQDGDEFPIVCVANATTAALLKEFFDEGDNIDLKVIYPSPLSITEYFQITPLHFEKGSITPSGLVECTLSSRISGSISLIDPHV